MVSATYDPTTKQAVNLMCDDGKGGTVACFVPGVVIAAGATGARRPLAADDDRIVDQHVPLQPLPSVRDDRFPARLQRRPTRTTSRCARCLARASKTSILRSTIRFRSRTRRMAAAGCRTFTSGRGTSRKLREVSLTFDAPTRSVRYIGAKSVSVTLTGRQPAHVDQLHRARSGEQRQYRRRRESQPRYGSNRVSTACHRPPRRPARVLTRTLQQRARAPRPSA